MACYNAPMKLDAATIAFLLAVISLTAAFWATTINLEQAAQIRRMEVAMRALCKANSPNHHIDACAEISLPLQYPPSPFSALIPDKLDR